MDDATITPDFDYFRGNAVKVAEFIEAHDDTPEVCAEVGKIWALLALAESVREVCHRIPSTTN